MNGKRYVLLGLFLLPSVLWAKDCRKWEPIRVRVYVADPEARIYFNGYPTRTRGPQRLFKTKPVSPCHSYRYEIAVESRTLNGVIRRDFHVGREWVLDFRRGLR